jgi:hypothetical protein
METAHTNTIIIATTTVTTAATTTPRLGRRSEMTEMALHV